jgi:hypothetical protein
VTIPESIRNLWMNAHAMAAMDSQVDVEGNSHCPWTVQATIYFCMSALGMSADFAKEPTRQEIITWLQENNMDEYVEYLMEE